MRSRIARFAINSKALFVAICALATSCGCDAETTQVEALKPNFDSRQLVAPNESEPTLIFEIGKFDWPQFRGPRLDSTQDSPDLPTSWSDAPLDEHGIAWTAELPGRGSSSPIVVGDYVFVTAYSGYGISQALPGDVSELKQHLICKNRETGETVWQRSLIGSPLTQRLGDIVLGHGFASGTPASDGEVVYAMFGATGVFAFDMNGNLLWQQNVGPHFNPFGSSASLTFYRDLLIVNASIENNTIYALNKKTGAAVWKIEDVQRCWSIPVCGKAPDGSIEMVINAENVIRGFDPETGEELWQCEGIPNYIIAVPVIRDAICYCNGGLQQETIAIRLGGRGDVTKTHQAWNVPIGANVGSPVWHDGVIFMAHDNGIMQSIQATEGKLLARARTGTKDRIYANPFLTIGQMYLPLQDEGVLIVEATDKMKEIRRNKIVNDAGPWHSSLVPNGDRFYIRTDSFLYCLTAHDGPPATVKRSPVDDLTKLIEPVSRLDFDAKTNRLQPYCYYLNPTRNHVAGLLLSPFKSVITEEQSNRAKEIIGDNFARFDELRLRQNDVFFDYMKGFLDESGVRQRLAKIDAETIEHSTIVRELIDQLVSAAESNQQSAEARE